MGRRPSPPKRAFAGSCRCQLFVGRSRGKSARGGCRLMGSRLPPRTTPDWAPSRGELSPLLVRPRAQSLELGYRATAAVRWRKLARGKRPRAKWPATIFLTTGLQDAVGAVLVRALRSSTIRVTDKNCGWRTAATNTPRRPGLAKALRGLDNGWYRHILADSTLSGRRGQRYTNICSASLGADWSISAWGS